jgi:hypothetical protein
MSPGQTGEFDQRVPQRRQRFEERHRVVVLDA